MEPLEVLCMVYLLKLLTQGALLHEVKYESELEVWGDGYRLVLLDPYNEVVYSTSYHSVV